jgi:hypothetical protein
MNLNNECIELLQKIKQLAVDHDTNVYRLSYAETKEDALSLDYEIEVINNKTAYHAYELSRLCFQD